MSKRYAAMTHMTRGLPEELRQLLLTETERHIEVKAAEEGYYLTGPVDHRVVDEISIDPETGEAYEIYGVYSSAPVAPLIPEWEALLHE